MRKLTRKERAEVYFHVAEILAENDYHICGQLSNYIDKGGWGTVFDSFKVCDFFKEFALFKPDLLENPVDCWFSTMRKEGMKERQTCMLLCYEMCINP